MVHLLVDAAVQYGRTRPDGVRVSIQHHHGSDRGFWRRIRIFCIGPTSSLDGQLASTSGVGVVTMPGPSPDRLRGELKNIIY